MNLARLANEVGGMYVSFGMTVYPGNLTSCRRGALG
jgi:hypothetical protein